jgi:lysozyme
MKTLILILLSLTVSAMDLTSTLKVEEGFSTVVYKDHLGFDTIGYGHRCAANHRAITKSEAEAILAADIAEAIAGVEKLIGKDHPQEVKNILTMMVFQMGLKGVKGFTDTLRLIRAKDYKGASKEMLNSKWAKQTPARAKRMSELMAAVK